MGTLGKFPKLILYSWLRIVSQIQNFQKNFEISDFWNYLERMHHILIFVGILLELALLYLKKIWYDFIWVNSDESSQLIYLFLNAVINQCTWRWSFQKKKSKLWESEKTESFRRHEFRILEEYKSVKGREEAVVGAKKRLEVDWSWPMSRNEICCDTSCCVGYLSVWLLWI